MNRDDRSYNSDVEDQGNSSPKTESPIEKIKHTIETDRVATMDPVDNMSSPVMMKGNKVDAQNDAPLNSSEGLGIVQSVGHLLRNARQERNLSIEDVARQLRLSPQQVESIEKENYDKLPGRVFLRGFVRNYANLLKLDPAPIIQLLPNQTPIISPVERTPFKIKEISFSSDQTRNWNGLLLTSVVLIFIGLVVYFVYPNDGLWDKSEERVTTAVERDADKTTIELSLPLSPSSSPVINNTESMLFDNDNLLTKQPTTALNTYGSLYFKFITKAHVKVIDGHDNTIFDQNSPAGSEHSISGKRPLFVVIQQAKGVELTYNDRPIEIEPYMNEQDGIARFTLE